MEADAFQLSEEQEKACQQLVNAQHNWFVTGKAGTGKSVLLNWLVSHTHRKVVVLAPTGLAAVHVKGQTIHSFFGLNPAVQNTGSEEELNEGMSRRRKDLLRCLDAIIIDEISMVRADVMDMMDRKLRLARGMDAPFGGCQMILFGDLYQLSPVDEDDMTASSYLHGKYGTLFFYGAPGYRAGDFRMIELTHVLRQTDDQFVQVLNHIRDGEPTQTDIDLINEHTRWWSVPENTVTLTPTNESANLVNERELKAIPRSGYAYHAVISKGFPEDAYPADPVLVLKVGARVMMIRNDPGKKWVNGTFATVSRLSEHAVTVSIGGVDYPVNKAVWEQYEYGWDEETGQLTRKAVAAFEQYPVRLAYAITIHKSQGQTFERAVLDIQAGRPFAAGQTYVALSRIRSFDGLYLTDEIERGDIWVNQEVTEYMHRSRKGEDEPEMEERMVLPQNISMNVYKAFTEASGKLPKEIKAKVESTLCSMWDNPELPGLHIEKINDSEGLYSARVDQNYRIIFHMREDSSHVTLLYVGVHEDAYKFARKHKVAENASINAVQTVYEPSRRITLDKETSRKCSRINEVTDLQMMKMKIPEEHWDQLRHQVFRKEQLVGFRPYLSEDAYDVLEMILNGDDIDETLDLYFSQESGYGSEVVPQVPAEKKPYFGEYTDTDLLDLGVPYDNLELIRGINSELSMQAALSCLPTLVQESLHALRNGKTVEEIRKENYPQAKKTGEVAFEQAYQSIITGAEFASVENKEALKAMLEYPLEKWRIFLHPKQAEFVRHEYNGPAMITGGAGTGKTVVIVHRVKEMAKNCAENERILVTTFTNALTHDLLDRLKQLCSREEMMHIDVCTVDSLTREYTRKILKRSTLYDSGFPNAFTLKKAWEEAIRTTGYEDDLTVDFCIAEWRDLVQDLDIRTWEKYENQKRTGRGVGISKEQKRKFWETSQAYCGIMESRRVTDVEMAQNRLAEWIRAHRDSAPQYKHVFIDECQDLRSSALRMLGVLAPEGSKNNLCISGDTKQRIYGARASLKGCGILVNNRSKTLSLNYRTTEEIFLFASRLLSGYKYKDMDDAAIDKDKTVCIFHGPTPYVRQFPSETAEAEALTESIRQVISTKVMPQDICIMTSTNSEAKRLAEILRRAGIDTCFPQRSDDRMDSSVPGVRLMTMHKGKGLEFSYVYLPCLSDSSIPAPWELKKAETPEEKEEIMNSESNLLYVAITRARYQVWMSCSGEPSRLIERYL